ncbi:hypothetical protein NEMIN01_1372 [Nematocida minor]|uniref:uncharacterized protein n=1 Tax=Nematocida minor TaxID=1912983 RepID=UPI00221E685B|nr:uncharacterized protein NEMIN01_1372 [Nematocida minor]KAI5191103.1 hypothetical protein NEMIN01_1372 [Nematocida minor]
MSQGYSKDIYREYVAIIESIGVEIPEELELVYKRYIKEQMMEMPYLDSSVIRMYTLVFFLKYVKQIQGTARFKDIYSKLEMQKKLITRAMETVDIDFGVKNSDPVLVEDWSSLYSMNKACGMSIINTKKAENK